MLGSQMYYEFIDDSPAALQRSMAHLKKELEARGVPRLGERERERVSEENATTERERVSE